MSKDSAQRSRLRWRCRRGMRELDALMSGYLDRHYDTASDDDRALFHSLLEWPDPELFRFLLGSAAVDDPALERLRRVITGAG